MPREPASGLWLLKPGGRTASCTGCFVKPELPPALRAGQEACPGARRRVAAALAAAVLLLGFGAASAIPALAGDMQTDVVGGHEPSQAYPGMAGLEIHLPDGREGFCGAQRVFHRWVAGNAHCVTTF